MALTCVAPCVENPVEELPDNNMPMPNPVTPGGTLLLNDFSPTATYVYHQMVAFNGKIFRATVANGPGAFNPAQWEEISAEGSVTIQTDDTSTILFEGDGSAVDPLIATFDETGLELWSRDYVRYVDHINGNDEQSGSILAPMKTIAAAQADLGSTSVIFCAPGTYNESLSFKDNCSIVGYGGEDSSQVVIVGSHTIAAGVQRVRLRNVTLRGATAGVATLTMTDTLGRHTFDNVSIEPFNAATTPVAFVGNNQNFIRFIGGSISGLVEMTTLAQVAALLLEFECGSAPTKFTLGRPSVQMVIKDMLASGSIIHTAGTLLLQNIGYVVKDTGTGNAIQSSADNGFIAFASVSLMQPDGSFGAFTKTGTCPYQLLATKLDPNGAALGGLNLFAEGARQVHANYSNPINYAPSNVSVREHLVAIDLAMPTAADGQNITFELAASKLNGAVNGEILLYYKTASDFTFPANLVGSQFGYIGDPSFVGNYSLRRNGVEFGTLQIDTNGFAAIVATPTEFLIGDDFSVFAANDQAFSAVSLTFQGLRELNFVP